MPVQNMSSAIRRMGVNRYRLQYTCIESNAPILIPKILRRINNPKAPVLALWISTEPCYPFILFSEFEDLDLNNLGKIRKYIKHGSERYSCTACNRFFRFQNSASRHFKTCKMASAMRAKQEDLDLQKNVMLLE